MSDQVQEIVDIIAAQIAGRDFNQRNNGDDGRHSRRAAEEIIEALRSRKYRIRKAR